MSSTPLHLDVVDGGDGGLRARRWAPAAFAIAGAAFVVAAFFAPWWKIWLYAPQYPGGLRLEISIRGMGGDVHEIDLLNHYIGMAHLSSAAQTEIRYAGWGVALVAVSTLLFALGAGRRLTPLVALPAVLFPIGFVADSFYWLWTFGHHLDPHAPLKIGSFTPELFGNGKIGQFETFAQPALGFWLAVAGAVVAIAAAFLRARACASCSRAKTCGATCPRLLVLPERDA